MTSRRRAMSLLEVLLGAAIMLLVLLLIYACFELMRRSSATTQARVDSRQQVRNLANEMARELRAGCYLWQGSTGLVNVTLAGRPYLTNSTLCNHDLVFARPLDVSQGSGNYTFAVVALTCVPRPLSDPLNPKAWSVVWRTWSPVRGAPALTPASDNPATINLPGMALSLLTERTFDCYLADAGGVPALDVIPGADASAVSVRLGFQHKPVDGPVQQEELCLQALLRNSR